MEMLLKNLNFSFIFWPVLYRLKIFFRKFLEKVLTKYFYFGIIYKQSKNG